MVPSLLKGQGNPCFLSSLLKPPYKQPFQHRLRRTDLALLFSPKGKVKTTVLGSLNVAKSFAIGKIGDKTEYPNSDVSGLAISTSWAAASKQSDGLHLQANVTLTNKSDGIVTIPDFICGVPSPSWQCSCYL